MRGKDRAGSGTGEAWHGVRSGDAGRTFRTQGRRRPAKPPREAAGGWIRGRPHRGGAGQNDSDRGWRGGVSTVGRRPVPRILAAMLVAFDWYSAIAVGVAAAVVGLVVLIWWWQGPPRR